MLQIRNFRVILQVLLHIVGQSSLVSADSNGDLDGVAGGSSDLVQNDAQTVDVVIQHLQDAVDVQVSDVIIACQQAGHEAVQHLAAGDLVLVQVDETGGVGDLIGQLHALLDDNDVALGGLDRIVDHVDHSLGLTGAFGANNQFNHSSVLLYFPRLTAGDRFLFRLLLLQLCFQLGGQVLINRLAQQSEHVLLIALDTRRTLAEFIKTEFKVSDLAFGQLNEQFIRDYQDFCLEKKKLAMETVRHYLSILKKICRIAYKEGHSEKYHFCHFKLPKQKETTPKALSRENFEKLRDLEIPEKRRSHVITRDLFLFACYTGTAYADAVSITRKNLFRDDEGSLWLKYQRKKTDYLGRVKLLPEAVALIEKYRDDTRETLFPPQDYHTLRANMKSLRLMAGLSQDLVYHMGRHSFASLVTLEEGVPIETICKMLGHSNIKTTQIYARVTPKKLFEDMDRFVEATRDLKLIL